MAAAAVAAAACQRTNLQRGTTSCAASWRDAKVTLLGIFKFEKTFISQSAAYTDNSKVLAGEAAARRDEGEANQDVLVKTLALGKA